MFKKMLVFLNKKNKKMMFELKIYYFCNQTKNILNIK